jgi:hypothetical protein
LEETMRGLLYRRAYGAAVAIILLTACGGSGVPSTTPAPQAAFSTSRGATTRNISGEYAGTITDNQEGKTTATAALAQYSDGVGGPFSIGKGSYSLIASIAFTLSGNTVSGTLVTPGTSVCAFSTSATYDVGSRRLRGSYTAIHGCSGEQGTYSLKRKCYYHRAGDGLVEPQSGPRPC